MKKFPLENDDYNCDCVDDFGGRNCTDVSSGISQSHVIHRVAKLKIKPNWIRFLGLFRIT